MAIRGWNSIAGSGKMMSGGCTENHASVQKRSRALFSARKPNFFIIGAPKCGTTSLAAWLSEHPQVFFSPAKEPNFFNVDFKYNDRPTSEQYERLFDGATESHLAIGEGSVWYLYSKEAVNRIEHYCPGSRYVVCLRNPIVMASSLHEQLVFSGREHVTDFASAWSLNEQRRLGRQVSRWCLEPTHLDYASACMLGDQVERLYANVDSDRIMTLLLDDVLENPRAAYRGVAQFLGLSVDSQSEIRQVNAAKERKSATARKVVLTAGRIKSALGIERGFGILTSIDRLNTHYRPRSPLSDEMKNQLQTTFTDDIAKLSEVIGRDLKHWTDV